jgi:hypothetical protein
MRGNLEFLKRERPRNWDPQSDDEFAFDLANVLYRIHPVLSRADAWQVAIAMVNAKTVAVFRATAGPFMAGAAG